MKTLSAFLLMVLSVGSANAAVYHGIFTGTVANLSEYAPFNNGDAFTLRFEIDTASAAPHYVGLDIAGVTGTFGNTFLTIGDDEGGIQDRFSMLSVLDSPVGIFDGQPNSNLSLEFIGGTGVFSGVNLDQPFVHTQFNTLGGSFDVNSAGYYGDLLVTSGFYAPGALPPVPLPAAAWLFGSGALGVLGFPRGCRKR